MSLHWDFEYDVIVIGGGPGGSTAATFISMQGHRVLLLEKDTLPAYKIGESLLPATVHGICPMLGVTEELRAANFMPKRGGTFSWGKSGNTWNFSFSASPKMPGPTSTAYQVERMKFDAILLNNAKRKGVDVRENHSVARLIMSDNRVAGVEFQCDDNTHKTAKARFVVDASGHHTSFARLAGERIYSQFFQNVALFGYYRGGARLPPPDQGNIFCAAFKHGWFWYIPLTDTLTSVGAVVAKDHASVMTKGYEAAMSELIGECPAIQKMLATATRVTDGPYGELRVRKDYSYANTKFWVPGLVLVGDAACFIDPVFSSGVHLATYSALLASRSINSCLAGFMDEDCAFTEFEARYRREYANFYDFLLAFYDASGDLDSYYWKARTILNSPETSNQAFIDLVAGLGASSEQVYERSEDFLAKRDGLGKVLFPESELADESSSTTQSVARRAKFYSGLLSEIAQVQLQAALKEDRPKERPIFPGGLVVSRDGLHWNKWHA